jgi:hypothetical protein
LIADFVRILTPEPGFMKPQISDLSCSFWLSNYTSYCITTLHFTFWEGGLVREFTNGLLSLASIIITPWRRLTCVCYDRVNWHRLRGTEHLNRIPELLHRRVCLEEQPLPNPNLYLSCTGLLTHTSVHFRDRIWDRLCFSSIQSLLIHVSVCFQELLGICDESSSPLEECLKSSTTSRLWRWRVSCKMLIAR